MLPWIQLDTAATPGGEDLRLMQRGSEFSIMAGAYELMNSRVSGSEIALATLSCAAIKDTPKPRLLIGGLGMGFTLRAALAELPEDARVEVAEIVPAVVAWAKGPLAAIHGDSLSDKRVTIRRDDVGRLIADANARYDAILLDVDNGPRGLSRPDNSALYSRRGLADARKALRPGGVLAVWSSSQDEAFARRLGASAFTVQEIRARARGLKGPRHTIWIATCA